MNLPRRLLPGIALIIGTFLLSVGLQAFAAWSAPSGSPPSSNAYAPLNTGPTAQTKSGNLTIGGQITITGGTPGAGKVLTSNASGLATWTTPSGVTSLSQGTGMSFSANPITTTGTINLANTGVTSGSYTNANITVDAQGRLTAASNGSGGGLTGSGSTNYISKWTGGTSLGNSQVYDNGTNIGIGTASPSEKLHVNGSLYVGNNWYKAGNITSVNNAISTWGAEGGVISGFASGRAVAMGQTTSGFAGLGISSGSVPLSSFYYDHNGNNTVMQSYGSGKVVLTTDFGTGSILFNTNGNVNRMTITSGGNVGIGNGMGAPWAQLDIGGSVGTNGVAFRAMDNTFSKYIMIVPYLGTGGYSGVSRSGDSGLFSAPGTGLVISPWNGLGIRISPSGDVGIGTTNPSAKLQVAGSGVFNNISIGGAFPGYSATWGYETIALPPNNNLRINFGSPEKFLFENTGFARSASGWTLYSDQRLKENVEELTGVVEKLKNIRGVKFNWKTKEFPEKGFLSGNQIGVIAQEVEQEFPEIVSTGPDGYKALDYGKLTPILIEAVKEQQKEIEALKSDNAELKARIDALEKR